MANRILWLDNSPDVKESVEEFLRGLYELFFVATAEEVFLQLEHGNCDLFVTNVGGGDSIEIGVLKHVQELWPEVFCLALYPAEERDAALAAIQAGASDVLAKPFDRENLLFTIQKALEQHKMNLGIRRYHQRLKEQGQKAMADLEKANRSLRRTRYYLENLLNSSVDTILTISTNCHITYANHGVAHMLGYEPDSLMGLSLAGLLRGGDQEVEQLQKTLKKGPIQNHDTEMLHEDGRFIPVMMSLSQVCSQSGKVLSVLAICKDITKQKHLENALKEKTITDDLTGLYNQRYFYERLAVEIERARRQNHPLSMLLFDVDHFKDYNDTHGHLEGDRVLQAIGEVVRESTRGYVDIGCRYGGDEFTVILPETGLEHARSIAERIRASFEARHFDNCTLSVGLMTYRKDTTPESFIRFADEMMYHAKRSGGNRVYVFDPEKNEIMLEK